MAFKYLTFLTWAWAPEAVQCYRVREPSSQKTHNKLHWTCSMLDDTTLTVNTRRATVFCWRQRVHQGDTEPLEPRETLEKTYHTFPITVSADGLAALDARTSTSRVMFGTMFWSRIYMYTLYDSWRVVIIILLRGCVSKTVGRVINEFLICVLRS